MMPEETGKRDLLVQIEDFGRSASVVILQKTADGTTMGLVPRWEPLPEGMLTGTKFEIPVSIESLLRICEVLFRHGLTNLTLPGYVPAADLHKEITEHLQDLRAILVRDNNHA